MNKINEYLFYRHGNYISSKSKIIEFSFTLLFYIFLFQIQYFSYPFQYIVYFDIIFFNVIVSNVSLFYDTFWKFKLWFLPDIRHK